MTTQTGSVGQEASEEHGDTIRQTIVETIEAPRLSGIKTEDFVRFKQKREIYVRRVNEKNSDTTTQIQLTTYRDSISKPILRLFVLGDWVAAETVDDITEQQLQECINEKARVKPDDYELGKIEHEIKTLKLEKEDASDNLEMQVWKLCLNYTTTLENCGYSEFITKMPEIAVEHLLKRVSHQDLKNRMLSTLKLNRDKAFKKNFKKFVKELAKEARLIDRINSVKRFQATLSDSDEDFIRRVQQKPRYKGNVKGRGKNNNPKDKSPSDGERTDKDTKGVKNRYGARNKRTRELPDCLNPKCKGQHFINGCPNTSEDEARKLKTEYHNRKRARQEKKGVSYKGNRKDGNVGQISNGNLGRNTSLFSGTFCNGAVETVILADQGADGNVIAPSTLSAIQRSNPSIRINDLKRPYAFGNASPTATPITCKKWIQADCMLRVRHSPGLMLRKAKWLVSEDEVEYVYLGRHVLAAMGLDNQELMTAARDRLGSEVDVPGILKDKGYEDNACANPKTPSIHSMLQQRERALCSTFHSEGCAEVDCLEESDVYVDLGDDPEEDLTAALDCLVQDGKKFGLSDEGCTRLTALLKQHRSVFDCGWENLHQPTCHQ